MPSLATTPSASSGSGRRALNAGTAPLLAPLAGIARRSGHVPARRGSGGAAGGPRHFDRRAEERAGDLELVVAEAEIERRREQHRRVVADGDGDRQMLAA